MATGNRIKRASGRSNGVSATSFHAELFSILGRFNDALAVAETAARALEAEEISGTGEALITLAQGVILLRRVYGEIDLVATRGGGSQG